SPFLLSVFCLHATSTPDISTPSLHDALPISQTAGQFAAGIDLSGKNAVVAGGLFVNNGYVIDSSAGGAATVVADFGALVKGAGRSEEHTSELQSRVDLVCRLLLEKKNKQRQE